MASQFPTYDSTALDVMEVGAWLVLDSVKQDLQGHSKPGGRARSQHSQPNLVTLKYEAPTKQCEPCRPANNQQLKPSLVNLNYDRPIRRWLRESDEASPVSYRLVRIVEAGYMEDDGRPRPRSKIMDRGSIPRL